jgi:hypothetical protein
MADDGASRDTAIDPPSPAQATLNEPVTTPAQATLRCQWCFVPLEEGTTICPTCGSPGVPDPRMTVPGAEPPSPAAIDTSTMAGLNESLFDAQGNLLLLDLASDDEAESNRPRMSWEDAERRQLNTIVFGLGAVIVCALLGWLAGPLLAGFVEGLTGTPVENKNDLRPMGAIFGLLGGFMVGAIGGIAIWSNR